MISTACRVQGGPPEFSESLATLIATPTDQVSTVSKDSRAIVLTVKLDLGESTTEHVSPYFADRSQSLIYCGQVQNVGGPASRDSETFVFFTEYPQSSTRANYSQFAATGLLEKHLEQQWVRPRVEVTADAIGLAVARRLEHFKGLEDGWADGMQPASEWGREFGLTPSHEGLDWLVVQFRTYYAYSLPQPRLYPTPEGGVQAEWSIGVNEASLEIDLGNHTAFWHNLNMRTDQDSDQVLNLDHASAWKCLCKELRLLELMAE